MTTKSALHELVESLPEERNDLARMLLEDLQDAADLGGPELEPETLVSLERGRDDVAANRVQTLEDYEHERGL